MSVEGEFGWLEKAGEVGRAVGESALQRGAGECCHAAGGRDLSDGVVVGIADEQVALGIEGETDGAVEARVGGVAIGGAPRCRFAGDGCYGAVRSDGADEVIAAIGDVENAV